MLPPVALSFSLVNIHPYAPSTPLMTDLDRQTSFLVLLTARALGSLGFGLSVLAIWVGWIIPPTPPNLPAHRDKSRRRSAPSVLPSQTPSPSSAPPIHATQSAPAPVSPILTLASTDPAPSRPRHVYFIDSDIRPSPLRRSTLPAYPTQSISDAPSPSILSPPSNSPVSSTSTLINPAHLDASPRKPYFEPCEEVNELDSAQLSARGKRAAPRLPRMKITFHGKGRRAATADSSLSPVVASPTIEGPTKPVKRANTVPWCSVSKGKPNSVLISEANRKPTSSRLSLARCLTNRPAPSTSPAPVLTPTLTSTPPPSSTSFFLKPQRRTSAPVRRTLPYEAPYFASPPLILEDDDRPRTRSFRGNAASAASDNGHEFGVVRQDRKYASTTSKGAATGAIPRRRSASMDLGERSTHR